MKKNFKYLKEIERYLNGEMGEDEKANFESELAHNPELSRDYKEHLEIYEAIGDKEVLELRQQLKRIHARLYRNKFGGREFISNNHWLLIAAGLLVLAGFLGILLRVMKPVMSEEQFLSQLRTNSSSVMDPYRLMPVYRDLLELKTRSQDFNFVAPSDSTIFKSGQAIHFEWKTKSHHPSILEILNSQGHIVFSTEIQQGDQLIFHEKLKKGVFVFRLQSDNRTLYYGVFFIL